MYLSLSEARSLISRLNAQPDLTRVGWLLAVTVEIAAAIKEVEKEEAPVAIVTLEIGDKDA